MIYYIPWESIFWVEFKSCRNIFPNWLFSIALQMQTSRQKVIQYVALLLTLETAVYPMVVFTSFLKVRYTLGPWLWLWTLHKSSFFFNFYVAESKYLPCIRNCTHLMLQQYQNHSLARIKDLLISQTCQQEIHTAF